MCVGWGWTPLWGHPVYLVVYLVRSRPITGAQKTAVMCPRATRKAVWTAAATGIIDFSHRRPRLLSLHSRDTDYADSNPFRQVRGAFGTRLPVAAAAARASERRREQTVWI